MNLVGELVMHKGRLEQIGATSKIGDLNETIEQIDRITGDLQSVVMKVRMVPIEQVFNRFPRMVRDLATIAVGKRSCKAIFSAKAIWANSFAILL